MAAVTSIDLTQNVRGILSGANGGLNANASGFTGIAREASGTMSASELSGDCTTSGSNVVTCQKANGTTVPVNSAADQALITTASATGGWATLPNGVVSYSTSTHTFSLATVITGTFADNETPTGSINGSNTTFTLAHTPSPAASLNCFENGLQQRAGGADYALATATMTYGVAPPTGRLLCAITGTEMNRSNRAELIIVLVAACFLIGSQTLVNLSANVTGVLSVANGGSGHNATVTALGTTGTVSMDFSLGPIYTVTPTGAITLNATNCATGKEATIIVTSSGTTSFTITPTTNFKGTALSTGTTTAKTFGWTFICNGTTAVQMGAATAAM